MIKDRIVTAVLAVVLALGGVFGGRMMVNAIVPGVGGEAYADAKSSAQAGVDVFQTDTKTSNLTTIVQSVMNGIFYAVGVLAVAMVVWGGVQYSLSAGDKGKVTTAKNTIVYGLVGMVIVIFSYAIVNFVLGQITGKE